MKKEISEKYLKNLKALEKGVHCLEFEDTEKALLSLKKLNEDIESFKLQNILNEFHRFLNYTNDKKMLEYLIKLEDFHFNHLKAA